MIELHKIKRNVNAHYSLSHSLCVCGSVQKVKSAVHCVLWCGVGGGDGGAPLEAARQRTKRGGDSGKQRQRKREKRSGKDELISMSAGFVG